MIYIGSDHRGFLLKEKMKNWLSRYEWLDLGALTLDPDDDYPTYASKVADAVKEGKDSLGILLCGSGVGADIVANKFDGIRASVGKSKKQVEAGRRDDNMNVLVIAADYTREDEAKEMIKVFLETKFDNKKRHKRRLSEIKRLEENN